MLAIQNFQQRLFNLYKETIPLPPTYAYLHGNPVQPLVPLHTPQRGVVIIGAYPLARFAAVGQEENVPVEDLTAPFAAETYFDGRRTRSTAGAVTLTEACLQPLGLKPGQCWLTNLVRVFLFADSHLQQYRRLGCAWPEWETRSRFEALARQGLPWLTEELALARPKLVIALGTAVAGILQAVNGAEARAGLLSGRLTDLWLDDTVVYPVIHLAQPNMAADDSSLWQQQYKEHLPDARAVVQRLVG